CVCSPRARLGFGQWANREPAVDRLAGRSVIGASASFAHARANGSKCPRLFSNRGGRVKFSNRGGRVKLGLKLAFAGVMVLSGVGGPPHDGCQGCDAARCEAI